MSPQDRRARDRFTMLLGLRAAGAALIALGLYLAAGRGLDARSGFGSVLIAAGVAGALVLPRLLARRWRSPR